MFQHHGTKAYKGFGLEKIVTLLAALDNPQDKFRSVHIAGTNGKGSSAHMLASILQSAGYSVGLHTSPHLKAFTERIRVDGNEMSRQAVVDWVAKHQPMIESICPTFFELAVAMAFDHFATVGVDIGIIEVGMGGRLDATNVLTPLVSLITNIGLDHQAFLGDTLDKIAVEKAGIMKRGVPTVIGKYQEETWPVFNVQAKELQSPLQLAAKKWQILPASEGRIMALWTDSFFGEFEMDLKGHYQWENLPGVLETLSLLKPHGFDVSKEAIGSGLQSVSALTGLTGRWQLLASQPKVIADTGHNEAGLAAILKQVAQEKFESLHWVWGMVADKDLEPILKLLPTDAIYYFCAPKIPRAMPTDQLLSQAKSLGLKGQIYKSVDEAYQAAKNAASDSDLIMIGGSTFVVAEIDEV